MSMGKTGIRTLLLALPNRPVGLPVDRCMTEFRSRERLWNTPHLGLLTIAALLPSTWQVTYVDAQYEAVIEEAYAYVLMSPSTAQAPAAYAYARQFRQRGARILLGGPHVSVCPEEALEHGDVVFIGEGEEAFPAFLEDERQGKARRIYQAQQHPPLEVSPVPRYELASRYPYQSIPIQLSRGCPHQCRFCVSSRLYGKAVRRKSGEQVTRELDRIGSLWKRPFLFFTDDNFFIDETYSHAVLDIIQRYPVEWYAFTDVDIYKKKRLLERLPATGCRKLLIGFESLDEDSLLLVNRSGFKCRRRHLYEEAVDTIQQKGIGVVGSFVLGLPGDTADTFERLYAFIYDTCLYGTNITVATPFPGTQLFEQYQQQGVVLPADWSAYDGFTLLTPLSHLSTAEFYRYYRSLLSRLNAPDRIGRVLQYFKAHPPVQPSACEYVGPHKPLGETNRHSGDWPDGQVSGYNQGITQQG